MQTLSRASYLIGILLAASASAMEYVEVCGHDGSCRKLSRLIMGTDHLAQGDWTRDGQPAPSNEDVFKVLDEAARLGINVFDTAPIYVGDVENKLGRWMKAREYKGDNPDGKLYALSKGGFPFDLYYAKQLAPGEHSAELKDALTAAGIMPTFQDVPPGTYASRLFGSEDQIASRVSEELGHTTANLNDNLTIYLMHRDDGDYLRFGQIAREKTPVERIMRALSRPEIAAKFWALGWSNWQTDRVNESVRLGSSDARLVKPLLNSPYFSLFEMTSRSIHAGGVQVTHAEMIDPNFQSGIKLNPYSPLGGFSVLDQPSPTWENAKKFAKAKYDAGDAYWQNVYPAIFTEANEARFNRVVAFTKSFNKKHGTNYTVDQMVNAYALAHRRMDFLTIGAITVEQLRRSVAALQLSHMLTDADLSYLYEGR